MVRPRCLKRSAVSTSCTHCMSVSHCKTANLPRSTGGSRCKEQLVRGWHQSDVFAEIDEEVATSRMVTSDDDSDAHAGGKDAAVAAGVDAYGVWS